MVVKAVCVINGDAKGTVFFEQEVRDCILSVFNLKQIWQPTKTKVN